MILTLRWDESDLEEKLMLLGVGPKDIRYAIGEAPRDKPCYLHYKEEFAASADGYTQYVPLHCIRIVPPVEEEKRSAEHEAGEAKQAKTSTRPG